MLFQPPHSIISSQHHRSQLMPPRLASYDYPIMAGLVWYPDDHPPFPTADHMHERSHQHQTFWRTIARKQPNQTLIPNQPDVDIRDAITQYLVEVEVPGVKDVGNIKCQWTSSTTLIISGQVDRPEDTAQAEKWQAEQAEHSPPYLVIGERRVGCFKRRLTFPGDIDHDKMTAKLEAGLLCIRIPKQHHHVPKGDGRVKIEVDE